MRFWDGDATMLKINARIFQIRNFDHAALRTLDSFKY